MIPTAHSTTSRRVAGLALFALACGLTGCDRPATDDVELSSFGVVGAEQIDERTFRLFDGKGNDRGSVELEDGTMEVELDGTQAEAWWSPSESGLVCDGDSTSTAEPDASFSVSACSEALTIGAMVADHQGVEVPGLDVVAPSEDSFRSSCVTNSFIDDTCAECFQGASQGVPAGWVHTGGSCTNGWIVASCTHTFCSPSGGKIDPELPTLP